MEDDRLAVRVLPDGLLTYNRKTSELHFLLANGAVDTYTHCETGREEGRGGGGGRRSALVTFTRRNMECVVI